MESSKWKPTEEEREVMEVGRLYEQPFTNYASTPDDLFKETDLDRICSLIEFVRNRAEGPLAA